MQTSRIRHRPASFALSAALLLPGLLPAPASAGDPPLPPPSLVPKPSAVELKPFTLEDRYLDAARRGDVATMKICLEKGVPATARDATGRSALQFAVRDARSLDAAKFLRERGLPVDDADGSGRTLLMDAAGNGDLALVSWLLEQGAPLEKRDAQGHTALHSAVLAGKVDVARKLLDSGAAIDARDNYQDTPLMGACAKGEDDMARLLVEKGADPSLRDQEGRLARERAAEGATYCRALPDTKPSSSAATAPVPTPAPSAPPVPVPTPAN